MKTGQVLNPKVKIAFASAILTLLVVGGISYRAMVASSESEQCVRHSHKVLGSLHGLLLSMEDVESSSRGFALSGNEVYVEAFRVATLDVARALATARDLTLDNPDQQRGLRALETLVAQKVEFGETVMDMRRTRGLDAAGDAIRGGQGQRIKSECRAAIRVLEDHERRLLVLRDADAKRRLTQTRAVLIVGTILGLLIAAAAVWSVRRDGSLRGRAEDALLDSEKKHRTLLNGIHDYAIFMLDPEGLVVSWNAGAERINGYTDEQIIGRNFSCLFPPADINRDKPERVLELTAASGRYEEQCMRVRRDGSQFLATVSLTALRDKDGTLKGFSEISRDLSESQESGARYRGLLEAAPDAIVVVNPVGEIVLLNLQAETQFGYRRDELVGQQVKNIIPEGFAERLIADGARSAAEALAQQIGTGIELSGLRKDGTEFPIEIMLSPLESADGILVTAAIRDISERKQAEEQLRRTTAYLENLIDFANAPIIVWDPAQRITRFNCAFERLTQRRAAEVLSQQLEMLFPDASREVSLAQIAHALEGEGLQSEEIPILRADGEVRAVLWSSAKIYDTASGGRLLAVIAQGQDITERKQAEARLQQKVDELYRSNKELEQFAYLASHDLQEPLRMVASYTQLLSRRYKGKLDSDADDFIAFAVDGASRMQRLIQDLLVFSRVGTKGLELIDTSSEHALQYALENLRGIIEESHALVTHYPLPIVLADESQLVQLFQNLVGNAIKYQSPGAVARVHISATTNGSGKWHFAVRDNGLGIDPQYFDRIFGMFQRLHKRDEYAGTGIGLAICKKIVERHGGSISVESKPGEGSTFRFALAASRESS